MLQPVRYDGEKAKALQEEENNQMRAARLQSFGSGVGQLGSETGDQDLQIAVEDHAVGYDLSEGDRDKAVNVVHGCVGTHEGQQTRIVAVGVGQLGPTAR